MTSTTCASSAEPATYGEGTADDPAGSAPNAGLLGRLEGADDPAVRRAARLAVSAFASELQARLRERVERVSARGYILTGLAYSAVAEEDIPDLLAELEVEQRTRRPALECAPEDAPEL